MRRKLSIVILYFVDLILTVYVNMFMWNELLLGFLPLPVINMWQSAAIILILDWFKYSSKETAKDIDWLLFITKDIMATTMFVFMAGGLAIVV